MSYFQQLLQTLKENGVQENEVGIILADLMKSASLKLYTQILDKLNDEDKQSLDAAADDQEKSLALLNELYQKYMNKTPDEAMEELQEEFAQKFLVGYQADKKQEEDKVKREAREGALGQNKNP